MRNERKEQIREVFAAPMPKRRREFFRNMETQPMHESRIMLQQFQYVSKMSWIVALAVLCIAFYLKRFYSDEMLAVILAMMPFLALTNVIESVRSKCNGMAEFEMSCRFSLKSIILIRMEIVGIENLIVGIVLAVLVKESLFAAIIYLFAPYLLTTYGCLLLSRKSADKEQLYFFMGIAVVISLLMMAAGETMGIYQTKYFGIWLCVVVALTVMVAKEYWRMFDAVQV